MLAYQVTAVASETWRGAGLNYVRDNAVTGRRNQSKEEKKCLSNYVTLRKPRGWNLLWRGGRVWWWWGGGCHYESSVAAQRS